MFKSASKFIIAAIMLVAFVGQVFANSTSALCSPAVDPHAYENKREAANHLVLLASDSVKLSKEESEQDCCDIDCCDASCICAASTCSSLVYLSHKISAVNVVVMVSISHLQTFEQPRSITFLPYRPPIFTS